MATIDHSIHRPPRTAFRLCLILASIGATFACAGSQRVASPWPEVRDPGLRSAGSLREAGLLAVRGPVAPQREVAQLRHHFDRVLGILESRGAPNATLDARRLTQIHRLRAYRDRGRFPENHISQDSAVPIFVDESDTACAVAWLMRQDGWHDAVDTIARENNSVFVPDLTDGPVLAWIAGSGLTREEAALIQPAYSPPDADQTLDQLLEPGASFTKGGVRYENFEFTRVGIDRSCIVCGYPHLADPRLAANEEIGVAFRQGEYYAEDGFTYTPDFNDWIFLGTESASKPIGQLPSLDPIDYLQVSFAFDVLAVDPGMGFGSARLISDLQFMGNQAEPVDALFASLMLNSTLENNDVLLSRLVIGDDLYELFQYSELGFLHGSEAAQFDPVKRLHIELDAYMLPESVFRSFLYEFDLVVIPEPTPISLLALGLVGLTAIRIHRKRTRT